jgi:ADP-ribose pyrophosphatase YjhB (NUDIX family)
MPHLYSYSHPRPAVTVDTSVFGYDGSLLHILLIRRANEPFAGYWALPGGFLNIDEELESAAIRELREETGLNDVLFLEQFRVYGACGRDPRGRTISIAFCGIVKGLPPVKGNDDADSADWFPIHEIPDLAFDHHLIIDHSLQWLRFSIANDWDFFKSLLQDERDLIAAIGLLTSLEMLDEQSLDELIAAGFAADFPLLNIWDPCEDLEPRKSANSSRKKKAGSTRRPPQSRRNPKDPPPK